MLKRFLEKNIISISRVLESMLTVFNYFVLISTIYFFAVTVQGVPFQIGGVDYLEGKYYFCACAAILEIMLTFFQRLIIRIVDPFPLSCLEKVISPTKAGLRIAFRVILLPLCFFIVIWIIDDYCKTQWLITYDDLSLIRFVCGMNFTIPFLSIIANLIHLKLWKTIV